MEAAKRQMLADLQQCPPSPLTDSEAVPPTANQLTTCQAHISQLKAELAALNVVEEAELYKEKSVDLGEREQPLIKD